MGPWAVVIAAAMAVTMRVAVDITAAMAPGWPWDGPKYHKVATSVKVAKLLGSKHRPFATSRLGVWASKVEGKMGNLAAAPYKWSLGRLPLHRQQQHRRYVVLCLCKLQSYGGPEPRKFWHFGHGHGCGHGLTWPWLWMWRWSRS